MYYLIKAKKIIIVIAIKMEKLNIDTSLSLKEQLIQLIQIKPKSFVRNLFYNPNIRYLLKWINDSTPLLADPYYTIYTKIWWILNDITDFPKCCNDKCKHGGKIKKNVYGIKSGYKQRKNQTNIYCCNECVSAASANTNLKRIHNIEKYGVSSFQQLASFQKKCLQTRQQHKNEDPQYQEKINKKTKKTRYLHNGNGNYFSEESINKCRYTRYQKNNGKWESDNTSQKRKNTCINKYGVPYVLQSSEFKEKSKKSCLQRYGVEYSFQSENNKQKSKETNLKKYGHSNAFAYGTTEFKQLMLERYGKEKYNNIQKIRKTTNDKYGAPCFFNSEAFKKITQNPEYYKNITTKQFETRRKNGTFNTSASEEEGLSLLKQKFGEDDIITQYKSKLYPWHCDYYVKSLDLYIELNEHWSHGGHPYDSNSKEDQLLVETWKSKNTKYYNNCIYVWTDLDVRKMQTAIDNKLHYIVFWKIEEMKEWIRKVGK